MSFTGSTRVGRLLLRSAADQVLSCSIELGGNAPVLVLADADVPAAVDGAMIATMRNGGEGCTAADRFFVHDAVADGFTATLAARLRMLAMGPAADPPPSWGRSSPRRPAATSTDSSRMQSERGGDPGHRRSSGGGPRIFPPAYVYTRDLSVGLRVAERLESAWSASTAESSLTPPPPSAG